MRQQYFRGEKRQAGFSIIQVSIAGGLMVAIGLGIASMMRESAVSLKRSEVVSVRRKLVDYYHDLIRNPQVVNKTVAGNANLAAHVAGTPPGPLTDPAASPPGPYYEVALIDQQDNIVIPTGGMWLARDGSPCDPPCTAANGYWFVDAKFAASPGGDFNLFAHVKQNPEIFNPDSALYDPTAQQLKRTSSASALGTSSLSQWTQVGDDIENINAGAVIINNDTDIGGGLRVSGATQLQQTMTGNLTAVGVTSLQNASAQTLTANRVVANTGAKLGDTGDTCNAGNAGLVAYRPAMSKLQYCDGSAWKDIGGGGGSLDFSACYMRGNPRFRGMLTFTCDDPSHVMIGFTCSKHGTGDHIDHCNVTSDSVTVNADDDDWQAFIKCCPPL